jgi:hypothetical protein
MFSEPVEQLTLRWIGRKVADQGAFSGVFPKLFSLSLIVFHLHALMRRSQAGRTQPLANMRTGLCPAGFPQGFLAGPAKWKPCSFLTQALCLLGQRRSSRGADCWTRRRCCDIARSIIREKAGAHCAFSSPILAEGRAVMGTILTPKTEPRHGCLLLHSEN